MIYLPIGRSTVARSHAAHVCALDGKQSTVEKSQSDVPQKPGEAKP